MTEEPRATVSSEYHRTDLNLSGYPDLPNPHGPGGIRPDQVTLQYGAGDRIRSTVHGLWVPEDESARPGERITREYDTANLDLADWPDWLAGLVQTHNPSPTREERAARMMRVAKRRESQGKVKSANAWRRTADDTLREPNTQSPPRRYTELA